MGGRKKKLIEMLEMELAKFIVNTGRTEQDIKTDYMDYHALQNKSKSGSLLNDYDIRRMKELYNPYLLGMAFVNKQKLI
jgi:hypothetical protein